MNECKSTADIVELMSRIVIVVDVDEGQKKKRPAATDRKEKREVSNGNTKRSMTVSRFLHDHYSIKEAVMQKGKGEYEHGCIF